MARPENIEALRALVLGREAQYREAIGKIVDLLNRSNEPDLAHAARGLATIYGFTAEPAARQIGPRPMGPRPVDSRPTRPEYEGLDMPSPKDISSSYAAKIEAFARAVIAVLSAHPGYAYPPAELRPSGVRAGNTWSRILEVVGRHPKVEMSGTTNTRRYQWRQDAQAIA